MKHIEQCGIVLMNKDLSKVLIVLQRESKKWGVPKGHLNDYEMQTASYFQCAKRELFEETGVWLNFVKNKTIGTLVFKGKFFYVIQINKDMLWTKPNDKNEIEKTMWLHISYLENFVKNNDCNSTLNRLAREMKKVSNDLLFLLSPAGQALQHVPEIYAQTYVPQYTHYMPPIPPALPFPLQLQQQHLMQYNLHSYVPPPPPYQPIQQFQQHHIKPPPGLGFKYPVCIPQPPPPQPQPSILTPIQAQSYVPMHAQGLPILITLH